MTSTPTARRLEAITALTGHFAPLVNVPGTQAELVEAVAALRPLGRSARWTDSIDAWVRLIGEKFEVAPAWALHQPAVWACNAA
jgi:hypothetical protein